MNKNTSGNSVFASCSISPLERENLFLILVYRKDPFFLFIKRKELK